MQPAQQLKVEGFRQRPDEDGCLGTSLMRKSPLINASASSLIELHVDAAEASTP